MIALFTACLGFTVLMLVPAGASAQESDLADDPWFGATRERLSLTDDQAEQLAPILRASRAGQKTVLSAYGIDLAAGNGDGTTLTIREARALKRDLNEVRDDTLEAVNDVLDAEQLEEFERIQAERSAEIRARIRGSL